MPHAAGLKEDILPHAACGVFIGDAILMFLAYAGVATLIKTTPVLFNIVRYLGAFYLLYLGAKILYATLTSKGRAATETVVPFGAIFKRALILSLTNPKAILFYVSFFVQFIDVTAPHTGVSFFILATTLEIVSFCYLSFLILSGAFVTHYIGTKKKLLTHYIGTKKKQKETGKSGQFFDWPSFRRICRPAGNAPVLTP
ncbi:Putative transport protein [Salmonella enterica subsp. enterica serovar Mississippi str. A4-633]|nr:Putative transport protein [Salmonella enterica subsp. enterica serovar Mississippi str. A4-633]